MTMGRPTKLAAASAHPDKYASRTVAPCPLSAADTRMAPGMKLLLAVKQR